MVRDLQPNLERMRDMAGSGFATATDLADWLVRVLKLPFRTAHHVTGRLVAAAEAKGTDLAGLTLAEMQAEEPGITQDLFNVITVDALRPKPHQLRRHRPRQRHRPGPTLAGCPRMTRSRLLLAVLALTLLAACGKKGSPVPPAPLTKSSTPAHIPPDERPPSIPTAPIPASQS